MDNPSSPRAFRIEHRSTGESRVIAHTTGVFAHHDTLTPYVIRLLMEQATGEVVLVDEETDLVVARRHLSSGVRPRRRTSAG